jgi:uncharacterized protein YbaR (Trm112 family)
VKASLADLLRCPVTGERVELVDSAGGNGGEIRTGRLRTEAGQEYGIVDGVPVMLRPETFAEGQAATRESFSEKAILGEQKHRRGNDWDRHTA